jgi:hypothetical protein
MYPITYQSSLRIAILNIPKTDQNIHKICQNHFALPFPIGHYYSPIPDVKTVYKKKKRWYREYDFTGVDFNLNRQKGYLSALGQYVHELKDIPDFQQAMDSGIGPGYGEVEAHQLYLMLRYLKPRRMIEIGSGVSTLYSIKATGKNRLQDGMNTALTCIEPYPGEKLTAFAVQHGVTLKESDAQDCGMELFSTLSDGDVLFIDSSHVCKIDSDVNYLYSDILPRLCKGVVIHIHDICFPYLTPLDNHHLFHEFLFWNEPVVVKAFLTYNTAFEIMLCQSWLHFKHSNLLADAVPAYDPNIHTPASLWIKKII